MHCIEDEDENQGALGAEPGAPDEEAGALGEEPGAPPNDDAIDEEEGAPTEADAEVEQLPRYALRPRGQARTGHFKQVMDQPHSDKSYYPPMQLMKDGHVNRCVVFAHVMNQMSAKAGIRKHGKAAEDAMMAEFSQMEDLNVYEPLDPKKLTRT